MSALPPYAELLRLTVDQGADGMVVSMPWHDDVAGRPGFLHGGAIAGLLEFSAFIGLRHAIGDHSVAMKPVTVTVDYLRGGTQRDTFAAAVIERLGNRIANVDAFAWQRDRSRPIASARINFLLERS